MILIIGGAYQGKLEYAKQNFGASDDGIIFNGFHNFVLEQLEKGVDSLKYIKENVNMLKDKIIISDDIFCGVVPVTAKERLWRETLGRVLTYLSNEADEVHRIFCGLGVRIK